MRVRAVMPRGSIPLFREKKKREKERKEEKRSKRRNVKRQKNTEVEERERERNFCDILGRRMGEDDEGEGEGGSEEDCRGIDRPPRYSTTATTATSSTVYR